jgi:Phosphodiester glycosidase
MASDNDDDEIRLKSASVEGKMKPALRRLTVVLCLLPVLLMVSGAIAMVVKAESSRFLVVAPGIEHLTFQVQPGDAEPFSGHAFKIDLDVAELRLVPAGGPSSRRTVEEIVAPYTAVVATNASFFDNEGRAMGLAVDEGRLIASGKRQTWGALVIDDKKARIVLGAEVSDPFAHRLVVQGIPRLVVGGKVQRLKPQLAERTAVCAGGSVVVLVVSTKAETTAFARFLADPPDKGGLACWDALNLDGGPSTQLVVKLPTLALSLPRGWGVPNALVVAPGRK